MLIFKGKDGNYYNVRYRDTGFAHEEDKGLLRCTLVDWNPELGKFSINDDDDWMLNDDLEVIAREVGWDLKRFTPKDWGFMNYMRWR